jgi:putative thioredoxin
MHFNKPGNQHVFDVHLHEFNQRVLAASHETPVMVDFWADWCSPCRIIAPNLIKAVEERNGAVLLAKLEVDEGDNMKLAGHYNVRGFPTVILFRDGEPVAHFSSAKPLHFIREFIDEHVDCRSVESDLGSFITD